MVTVYAPDRVGKANTPAHGITASRCPDVIRGRRATPTRASGKTVSDMVMASSIAADGFIAVNGRKVIRVGMDIGSRLTLKRAIRAPGRQDCTTDMAPKPTRMAVSDWDATN